MMRVFVSLSFTKFYTEIISSVRCRSGHGDFDMDGVEGVAQSPMCRTLHMGERG